MEDESKSKIKYVYGRISKAYNNLYGELAKTHSKESIDCAVTLCSDQDTPEGLDWIDFASYKGLNLALELTEQLKELHRSVPETVGMDTLLKSINQALSAGICFGAACHGSVAILMNEKHKPFENAGKKSTRKKDELGQRLETIVQNYVETHQSIPTAAIVWKQLKKLAGDGVIQEVKGGKVFWMKKGKELDTRQDMVNQRLTSIRKKYSGLTG